MDFFIDKMEYFIVAAGILVSFYIIEGTGNAGKNYGDVTQLVKQYKKIQQSTNIKNK